MLIFLFKGCNDGVRSVSACPPYWLPSPPDGVVNFDRRCVVNIIPIIVLGLNEAQRWCEARMEGRCFFFGVTFGMLFASALFSRRPFLAQQVCLVVMGLRSFGDGASMVALARFVISEQNIAQLRS